MLRSAAIAFALAAASVAVVAAPAPLASSPFAAVLGEDSRIEAAADRAEGNRAALLSHGYDALALRIHLIRHATTSIEIQTFIWTNDEVGRLLVWELIEAARRGVKVRIVADQMFSEKDPEIAAFLATVHPNFEVRHYRPAMDRLKPSLWRTLLSAVRSFRDINQRMHSKVMLVDGAVLITGGRNIENTYFDHSTGLNFRDRDVLVVGPVVRTASEQFEQFWSYRHTVPSRELVDVARALERGTFRRYDRRGDYDFGGYFDDVGRDADDAAYVRSRFCAPLQPVDRAMFIYDAPGKTNGADERSANITRELARALAAAKASVVIQTPYLVLSPTARSLLLELRERTPAIDIRVATNSFASTDNLYAYSANYRLRNDYVRSLGLSVYEYKPQPADLRFLFPKYDVMCAAARAKAANENGSKPFLSVHAKSLVVDNTVGFVGSFNLDPRSERLNTEVGLMVVDPAFAQTLREEIERDMLPGNSWAIGRRRLPLRFDVVNGIVGGILSLSPIELWPIQNTTSFELLPGRQPVPPSHPNFHDNYRELGPFPGTEGLLTQREILTRIYKAVGSPLTPIL